MIFDKDIFMNSQNNVGRDFGIFSKLRDDDLDRQLRTQELHLARGGEPKGEKLKTNPYTYYPNGKDDPRDFMTMRLYDHDLLTQDSITNALKRYGVDDPDAASKLVFASPEQTPKEDDIIVSEQMKAKTNKRVQDALNTLNSSWLGNKLSSSEFSNGDEAQSFLEARGFSLKKENGKYSVVRGKPRSAAGAATGKKSRTGIQFD